MARYELHRPDGAVENERQGSLTYRWVLFAPSKVDEVWLHQHECKSHSDTFQLHKTNRRNIPRNINTESQEEDISHIVGRSLHHCSATPAMCSPRLVPVRNLTFNRCSSYCECFFRFAFQSYLRRLQEHQMGTGSSTSSVSTITHTLIDFDFETGSMVPLTAASPAFTVWSSADLPSSRLMCTTLRNLDTCILKDVSPVIRKASPLLVPDGESKLGWTVAKRTTFAFPACVFNLAWQMPIS